MKLGPGLGMRPSLRDVAPPVISGVSYNSATNVLSLTSSEPGTFLAVWSLSASLTNAQVQAQATHTQSAPSGASTAIVSVASLTTGTWYLHHGVRDSAGNFGQGTPPTRAVA